MPGGEMPAKFVANIQIVRGDNAEARDRPGRDWVFALTFGGEEFAHHERGNKQNHKDKDSNDSAHVYSGKATASLGSNSTIISAGLSKIGGVLITFTC